MSAPDRPWQPRLSLGPLPYFWPRQAVFDFYERMAQAPFDVVYLGETICSKRRALRLEDWLAIAAELTRAGKEVVLSTLTLIESESEVTHLKRVCANGRYWVEANDMGAVNLLVGSAFVAGPTINIYNSRTLARLAGAGAARWVLPTELGRDTLTALQAARPPGLQTEALVHGRLPLSYSARCFTARAHNRAKDDCGFLCLEYSEGMPLESREGEPFLVLNGIQTQSALTYCLVGDLADLRGHDIDVLRISPQHQGTAEIAAVFRDAIAGTLKSPAAQHRLAALSPGGLCDGYWQGRAGMTQSLSKRAE